MQVCDGADGRAPNPPGQLGDLKTPGKKLNTWLREAQGLQQARRKLGWAASQGERVLFRGAATV